MDLSVNSITALINRALYLVSAILILIVTVLIVVDVGGRALFNAPLTGTVEIVSNVIVVIAFLQLSYAVQTGGMFHSTIILGILPNGFRNILALLAELAGAALCAMMLYASWEPMLHAWHIGEYYGGGDFRFPVYPVRSIIVLCCGLACINYLLRGWQALIGNPQIDVDDADIPGE